MKFKPSSQLFDKMKFSLFLIVILVLGVVSGYSKYEYDMSSSNCANKVYSIRNHNNLKLKELNPYRAKCLSENSSGSWFNDNIKFVSGLINNTFNYKSFSIEMWFYYTNLWNPEIFGIYDTTTNNTILSIHSDYIKIQYSENDMEIFELTNIWELEQMIISMRNNIMEIYLSGNLEYEVELRSEFNLSEYSYYILSFYEGLYIYNLNIYNGALSAVDVGKLYNQGVTISLPVLYDQVYYIEENSNISFNFNYSWSDELNNLPNLNYCLFKVYIIILYCY